MRHQLPNYSKLPICFKHCKSINCTTSFFLVLLSSFTVTPLWWGPYFTVSSYLGLFIHSLQLLRRRLSLIAHKVSKGCRVVLQNCLVEYLSITSEGLFVRDTFPRTQIVFIGGFVTGHAQLFRAKNPGERLYRTMVR